MATEGEAVRAVAWRREGGAWWGAAYRDDGTVLGPSEELCEAAASSNEAMLVAADLYGVGAVSVAVVSARYAPDGPDAAESATASAYGMAEDDTVRGAIYLHVGEGTSITVKASGAADQDRITTLGFGDKPVGVVLFLDPGSLRRLQERIGQRLMELDT